jgi:RHS repeat-associated protein
MAVSGYVYGRREISIEQINNSTGAVEYLHHDQAGSTRLLTGSTGKVEGKCSYSAYGVPDCEGTATTPLGWDGRYTSSDTGLVYMRAREYDPSTAQFLTVDPLVGITGAPYNYAFDDPVNLVDPTGLDAIPFPIAGPQDLSACADPITIAICGAGGVYAAKELYNAFAGEAEPGNDEGEALVKKQAEEAEQQSECGEVTFGHGGRHLEGTGLNQEEVERAIEEQVNGSAGRGNEYGPFGGRVTVGGKTIEYIEVMASAMATLILAPTIQYHD